MNTATPAAIPEPRRRRRNRSAHHPALRGLAALGLTALFVTAFAPAASAAPTTPDTAVQAAAAPTGWAGDTPNTTGGTDYFVDATAGDDAAAGTSADTAWKSFTPVNAKTFAPGDRVLLKAGETWSDTSLWPKGSGTEAAPIVIDAYGAADARRPYIATNGQVPSPFTSPGVKNPETVGLTGAVILRNQQYVHIANLEVSNDDDFATDITTGSYVRDGVSVSINADKLEAGADSIMRGISVTNVFAHDIDGPSSWQKIHYAGVNFQVFGSQQYTAYPTGGHHFEDISIQDNTFENVELHAVQFAFNWFGDQQGQTDASGKYHEGWEQLWVRDRDLYSRDVTISHNYAESTGQGPFQFANTQRLTAEYNEANGWLERYNQVSAGLYLWAGADSVMRFNEIYGGPANEYDATPWDLEFTNFNVVYEHNYSHDNQGGWMSYMGNSSNSIARYNLSVNDNGVIFKNMLSSNYSPTYILNNVFVYDGAELESFHDEVLKDRVYFANNVFYNTSTTTSTNWARKAGGLDKGVFSNNAYFEASGKQSANQPVDKRAVVGDPEFVGNPADYAKDAGVDAIRDSASLFKLQETSPLIDAGRYNERIGSDDFFGTELYYGDGVDIGLYEAAVGAKVDNPVDTDPIENEGVDTRVDLAKGKPIVASSTHPHNDFEFNAGKLVDGDPATRWAGADDATYPLTIDIDFGADTTFDEVDLSEFTDSGTDARVNAFSLQRWDAAAGAWVGFSSQTGIGASKVVKDFGSITSSKLRVSLESLLPGQVYAPTLTTISVFNSAVVATDPTVTPTAAVMDKNAAMAEDPDNLPTFTVDLDGDTLTGLRYVQPSGAIVGSLDDADFVRTDTADGATITLTNAFAADKELGASGVVFEFGSNTTERVTVEIVDTTELAASIATARALLASSAPAAQSARAAVPAADGAETLTAAIASAEAVLALVNRDTVATGNTAVTNADVQAAVVALNAAIEAFEPGGGTPVTPGGPGTPGTPSAGSPGTGGSGATGTGSGGGSLASTGVDGLAPAAAGILLLLAGAAALTLRARRASAMNR